MPFTSQTFKMFLEWFVYSIDWTTPNFFMILQEDHCPTI